MNYKSGFFVVGGLPWILIKKEVQSLFGSNFEEFVRGLFDPPPKINPHRLKWVKFVRYLKSGVLFYVMDESLENGVFLKRFENSGRSAVLAEAEAERSLYISMLALAWLGLAWRGVAGLRRGWAEAERSLCISRRGLGGWSVGGVGSVDRWIGGSVGLVGGVGSVWLVGRSVGWVDAKSVQKKGRLIFDTCSTF